MNRTEPIQKKPDPILTAIEVIPHPYPSLNRWDLVRSEEEIWGDLERNAEHELNALLRGTDS